MYEKSNQVWADVLFINSSIQYVSWYHIGSDIFLRTVTFDLPPTIRTGRTKFLQRKRVRIDVYKAKEERLQRIVGGKMSGFHQHPWQVSWHMTKLGWHMRECCYCRCRVAKCHGYDRYIRVKIFRGWGKKSERTHNMTKLGLFWKDLHNLCKTFVDKLV